MAERPSGTVTFLFTDVEGSTGTGSAIPLEMDPRAGPRRDPATAIGAAEAVFATGGDGFAAVFARADVAVAAAVARRGAHGSAGPTAVAKVRMGLHTGEGHERDGDYFGPAVNHAARVMDAANGSQIVSGVHPRGRRHELGPATTLSISGCRSSATWSSRCASTASRIRRSRATGDRLGRAACGPATCRPLPGLLLGRAADVETLIEDLARARSSRSPVSAGSARPGWRWRSGRRLQPTGETGSGSPRWTPSTGRTRMVPSAARHCSASSLARDGTWTPDRRPPVPRALLILDNCEHLLDAAAEVAEPIVGGLSERQVLATSREPSTSRASERDGLRR